MAALLTIHEMTVAVAKALGWTTDYRGERYLAISVAGEYAHLFGWNTAAQRGGHADFDPYNSVDDAGSLVETAKEREIITDCVLGLFGPWCTVYAHGRQFTATLNNTPGEAIVKSLYVALVAQERGADGGGGAS